MIFPVRELDFWEGNLQVPPFIHSFKLIQLTAKKMEHEKITLGYLSFIRRQRGQSLLDLSLAFQDTIERRVVETTYDSSDVLGILKELETAATAIFGNELQLYSHMNILLLQQLLQQAVSSFKLFTLCATPDTIRTYLKGRKRSRTQTAFGFSRRQVECCAGRIPERSG